MYIRVPQNNSKTEILMVNSRLVESFIAKHDANGYGVLNMTMASGAKIVPASR